jgi:hypothetical protein
LKEYHNNTDERSDGYKTWGESQINKKRRKITINYLKFKEFFKRFGGEIWELLRTAKTVLFYYV